ncbi:Meiotically up-regulated gene 87 protein [Choanephora cucurbitarum]|uniref:Nuclear pore protein n=1 Tax=Choanephora cucurbitarum TaxID=101091 RepID=A0A1C7NI86_9FUNG|nr:Meiotically up-regulated gene 87 protein [Choanephora cucurbitarum]
MTPSSFEQLLQDSKKLTDLSANSGLPQFNRDLVQIANESYLLSSRFDTKQELNANAHYFLAQGGSNSHEVANSLKKINTSVIFKSSDMIKNTNVEIQRALESRLRDQLHSNWKDQKAQILQDWDQQDDNTMFGRTHKGDKESLAYKKRVSSYQSTIRAFNNSRILHEKVPIFSQFKTTSQSAECTKAQRKSLEDAWDVAAHIANESDSYVDKIYSKHQHDPIQVAKTNRLLINRVKCWLEQQYLDVVNKELTFGAFQGIGGSPSVLYRMNAFSKMMGRKLAGSVYLEVKDETPIWLFVYILVRVGKLDLAYEYVENRQAAFCQAPAFLGFLKEYVHADNHRLSEATRQRVCEHYRMMDYGNNQVDPYQKLIYKIMGRCELHLKSVDDIEMTIEDFLWLQYTLIDEDSQSEVDKTDSYRLLDLQRTISAHGTDYFDSKKTNPWYYFYVLVLTLQFERAISFMYTQQPFRLEAVHFSIALAYYNLIRIPNDLLKRSRELLIVDSDGTAYFNFGRLIKEYVDLLGDDVENTALEYYCLITLYQSAEMKSICYGYIANYIATLDDYKRVIGDLSTYQTGSIERLRPLLGIGQSDEEEYNREVLARVANKFRLDNRYKDTVSIYLSMGDNDNALSILNHQLDLAIERPMSVLLGHTHHSLPSSDQDLINYCTSFIQAHQSRLNTTLLRTCCSLLLILQACVAYERRDFESALLSIKQFNIVPFEGQDMAAVLHYGEVYKSSLDKISKKHIPGLISMIVEILSLLYKNAFDQSMRIPNQDQRAVFVEQYKSYKEGIRSTMAFVGIISSDIQPKILKMLLEKTTGLC